MNRLIDKKRKLDKRIQRIRHSIKSKTVRPRLVIQRSNRYLSVQIIDDTKGVTLCAASTLEKDFQGSKKNREAAAAIGKTIAVRAIEKGIKAVVLDRRGRLYHGRIKDLADSARENGLEF
jgi:large subunit ribosomal protein L18